MMEKRIGVRFCGGCNPRYHRGDAYRRIAAEVRELSRGRVQLSVAEEGTVYDGLLIIGGCHACCAGYDQFTNLGPVWKLTSEADAAGAAGRILADV